MAVTIPIKFFNSFVLQNSDTASNDAWHIEESRIKGGFNEASVDLGVKAYVTDENYNRERKRASMIYSGVFNSSTGKNDTNQFSVGETISKDLDETDGGIQKLYTEDTSLIIFQEDKVSRSLVNKNAIFSADGGGTLTSTDAVIGENIPYSGRYGISDNPESFAAYGGRKYFADKNRGVVLRLSQDGITEISDYGMKSFFRDNLRGAISIFGSYDVHHHLYLLSINNEVPQVNLGGRSRVIDDPERLVPITRQSYTLSFDEDSQGWTSFYSFVPRFGTSLNGRFYTCKKGNLWQHYSIETRNSFYGVSSGPSHVTLVVNTSPSDVKSFRAVSYEGTDKWNAEEVKTDVDTAFDIVNYVDGIDTDDGYIVRRGFDKKENKFFGPIRNNSVAKENEVSFGGDISGVRGYFLNLKLTNYEPTYQELFSVSTDFNQSLF